MLNIRFNFIQISRPPIVFDLSTDSAAYFSQLQASSHRLRQNTAVNANYHHLAKVIEQTELKEWRDWE